MVPCVTPDFGFIMYTVSPTREVPPIISIFGNGLNFSLGEERYFDLHAIPDARCP